MNYQNLELEKLNKNELKLFIRDDFIDSLNQQMKNMEKYLLDRMIFIFNNFNADSLNSIELNNSYRNIFYEKLKNMHDLQMKTLALVICSNIENKKIYVTKVLDKILFDIKNCNIILEFNTVIREFIESNNYNLINWTLNNFIPILFDREFISEYKRIIYSENYDPVFDYFFDIHKIINYLEKKKITLKNYDIDNIIYFLKKNIYIYNGKST